MNDEEICSKAIVFAKYNKEKIARKLTDPAIYIPDAVPISVFMAGSPGAGKTEFSKNLISILEKNNEHRVIRIDGDEIRSLIPGYVGSNSYLFQGAVSLIVEKIHDCVLHNGQTFVFDSTFSKYDKAIDNIKRSLKKKRPVFIFYVYQKPEVAWKFTEAREKTEGRNIPKSAFIDQFFGARDTINRIRLEFTKDIVIFLVKKDFDKNTVENIIQLKPKEPIDNYIDESYTKEKLEEELL